MKKLTKKTISILVVLILMTSMLVANFSLTHAASPKSDHQRVAAGTSHALFIDEEGNVWSMGSNRFNQLGNGTQETRWEANLVYHNSSYGKAVSVAAGSKQSLLLTEKGEVYQWGYEKDEMTLQFSDKVSAIYAGGEFCMALLPNRQVKIWSDKLNAINVKDESGVNSLGNIRDISIGSNETILLLDLSGVVYQLDVLTFRANPVRLLQEMTGPEPSPEISLPEESDSENGISGGEDGPEESEDPPSSSSTSSSTEFGPGEILNSAVSIAAGSGFGLALMPSGQVYGWGQAPSGILGTEVVSAENSGYARKLTNVSIPLNSFEAGSNHVIGLSDSGDFYGWGNYSNMRQGPEKKHVYFDKLKLEYKDEDGDKHPIKNINYYANGSNFSIAMDSDKKVFIWGNDKQPMEVELVETFKRTSETKYDIVGLSDKTITVKWDPDEFYKGLITGFRLTAVMPNGDMATTPIIGPDTSQITLSGLQAETNYLLSLEVHGKSGFVEIVELTTVKTLKLDEITPTLPVSSSVEESAEESEVESSIEESSEESQDLTGGGKRDLSDIFGILLIVLVFVVIVGAIIAIVVVWKRVDRDDKPRVKPVRIMTDDEPESYDGYESYDAEAPYGDASDDGIQTSDDQFDEGEDGTGAPISTWHNVGDEEEDTQSTEDGLGVDGESNPDNDLNAAPISQEADSLVDQDDFDQDFDFDDDNDDDDDDFIIRRPGQPRK